MGVPVKPMNEAFGSASRMCRAKPSMKSYWLRCASSAMTTMFRRSESGGCFPPFSSGKNLWMVVKITPPLATFSKSRKCSRLFAWTRLLPQQFVATRERAEKLVVQVVPVGEQDKRRILHRRFQHQPPGVESHGERLARTLRMPDHAHAPVTGRAPGLRLARSSRRLSFNSISPTPRMPATFLRPQC